MTRTPVSVLVVEDEGLIRMATVEFLTEEGFVVFEAKNADEAIRILELNHDIHLLFTDIDMPGSMDGLKLSAAVRDRWPPVRIVVTSGKRAIDASDMPAGSLFFPKPYRHADLVASFRKMISDHGPSI